MSAPQPKGFLAIPKNGEGPPVLVLHAWWGLNDTIKAFCTRLSDAGYSAFAPDLYHGKVTDTIPGAEALAQALEVKAVQASAEVLDAAVFLAGRSTGHVSVVGFSLGAFFALNLAASCPEHVRSVVLFYGTGSLEPGDSKASYLGHFAQTDPYESLAQVDALGESLAKAGRPVEFHVYPGTGHWFVEPDRTEAFNPEAAALAWDRTLAFLAQTRGS